MTLRNNSVELKSLEVCDFYTNPIESDSNGLVRGIFEHYFNSLMSTREFSTKISVDYLKVVNKTNPSNTTNSKKCKCC